MLEATLEAEIDGEKVPFRMLRPTLGNEPPTATSAARSTGSAPR